MIEKTTLKKIKTHLKTIKSNENKHNFSFTAINLEKFSPTFRVSHTWSVLLINEDNGIRGDRDICSVNVLHSVGAFVVNFFCF